MTKLPPGLFWTRIAQKSVVISMDLWAARARFKTFAKTFSVHSVWTESKPRIYTAYMYIHT